MRNESLVFDQEITYLEIEMDDARKHLISTETLRNRAIPHFDIATDSETADYFVDVGIGQVMQSRLHARGYRSVRRGYFVNLDRCDSLEYLTALLGNSELDIESREKVMKKIKEKRDGQTSIDFATGTIHVPMTEEEFMREIEADAV